MDNPNRKEAEVSNIISEQKVAEQKGRRRLTNRRYFSISLYAIFVILIGSIIWKIVDDSMVTYYFVKLLSIVSPFIVGAFIAFLLNPVVEYFDKTFLGQYIKMKSGKSRLILSIVFTYVIFFGLIIVLLAYIIPQIIESLKEIALNVPAWYSKVETFLLNFKDSHPNLDIDYNRILEEIQKQNIVEKLIDMISGIIPNIFTFVLNASVTIIKLIVNSLIAIMVSVYLIIDKKTLLYGFKRILYAVFPKKATESIITVLKESNSIFSGFIFGKAVDSLIIGIICFIAMNIFRIEYSLLISVIVGITNMIPYFGPYMGGAIGAIFLIMLNPIKTFVFVILIIAIQQFDGLYLGPKILGKSMGIKPLWIIFSITVGGSLFGVLGMFLGVPVFSVILYIINRLVEFNLQRKGIEFDENNSDLSHHIKKKRKK